MCVDVLLPHLFVFILIAILHINFDFSKPLLCLSKKNPIFFLKCYINTVIIVMKN